MNASTAASPPLPLRHSYWVVPGLLLAGEHPGGPTRDKTKDRLKKLLASGIECFIDLTKPTELPRYDTLLPFYVEYSRKSIKDHGLPASRDQMIEILDALGNAMRAGRPAYVHCRAGIGRTGTVVGCLLVERGLTGNDALDELNRLWQQSKRSKTWPYVPETEAQASYVREWQPALTSGGGFEISPAAAAVAAMGPIAAPGDARPGTLTVADVQARAASHATGAGQARAAMQNIAAKKGRKDLKDAGANAGASYRGLAAAADQARAAVEAGQPPAPLPKGAGALQAAPRPPTSVGSVQAGAGAEDQSLESTASLTSPPGGFVQGTPTAPRVSGTSPAASTDTNATASRRPRVETAAAPGAPTSASTRPRQEAAVSRPSGLSSAAQPTGAAGTAQPPWAPTAAQASGVPGTPQPSWAPIAAQPSAAPTIPRPSVANGQQTRVVAPTAADPSPPAGRSLTGTVTPGADHALPPRRLQLDTAGIAAGSTQADSGSVEPAGEGADPLFDSDTLMAARALRERFVGAMLGLAVGDALAAATQYRRPGTFTPIGDMIGGGPFDLPRGAWSDDTAMALCLAESLLEREGFDARDQVQRYTRWQQEGYLSSTGQCVGITASTARSLAIAKWRRVVFPGSHDPEQLDPEPLSRIAPVALYYFASVETTLQQAAESSRTTCQAPAVLDACRHLARSLHAALSGQPKAQILNDLGLLPDGAAYMNSTAATALAVGLWAFRSTDNFRDALLLAINVGGNSDVVASVCGQLAGAHYGFSAIPAAWLNGLMHKDLIESYADRMLAHALVALSN